MRLRQPSAACGLIWGRQRHRLRRGSGAGDDSQPVHHKAEFHEASIAAILLDAAKMPQINAMHLWYEGVSIGTKATDDMRYWAQVFAQDLIDLWGRFQGGVMVKWAPPLQNA